MPFAIAEDGTRLYYESAGEGEPLLLIAGQGSDHRVWTHIRERFTDRYRVILFDHRGTGQSGKPEDPPYSTRGFADDAIAILDDLKIDRAHVWGISMGGRVCQWLAVDHPQRMGAVVLACTTPGNAHGAPRDSEVDAAMASGDLQTRLDLWVSPAWASEHPAFLAEVAELARHPSPPHAQRMHYRASEEHDAWDLLPQITAPVLVIHGSEDRVNPTANAPLLAQRIPGAEVWIVQGGRHAFVEEFREETCREVLAFLERHPLGER